MNPTPWRPTPTTPPAPRSLPLSRPKALTPARFRDSPEEAARRAQADAEAEAWKEAALAAVPRFEFVPNESEGYTRVGVWRAAGALDVEGLGAGGSMASAASCASCWPSRTRGTIR